MILLDTDVVSFLHRGDPRGSSYLARIKDQPLAVSFMTVAELFAWAERRQWGEHRRAELDHLLRDRYLVVGFEMGLAREWARVRTEGWALGKPISVQDGYLVGSA